MTGKTCAHCGRPFVGKKKYQTYCSRPCWRAAAAGADQAADDRATARAGLRDVFGNLTDRDQAIFRAAYDLGYRRGFARGYDRANTPADAVRDRSRRALDPEGPRAAAD